MGYDSVFICDADSAHQVMDSGNVSIAPSLLLGGAEDHCLGISIVRTSGVCALRCHPVLDCESHTDLCFTLLEQCNICKYSCEGSAVFFLCIFLALFKKMKECIEKA